VISFEESSSDMSGGTVGVFYFESMMKMKKRKKHNGKK
jgi:hypothetical protein